MKKTFKPFTAYFVDKSGKRGSFKALARGTNFDYRLSPEEAARLVREHGEGKLPFAVMCKEYGDDGSGDWSGMTEDDINEAGEERAGLFDEDYKTFETWADDLGAAYFTPCAEPKDEEPPADPVALAGVLADYLEDCHKDNQQSDYSSLHNNPAMTEAEAMEHHKKEPEGCLYCDAIAAARAMQAKAAALDCKTCEKRDNLRACANCGNDNKATK